MERKITFTITSCGRLELLKTTIESFREYARYPIERWILVEDSGNKEMYETLLKEYPFFEVRFNEKRLGPIGALYRAWEDIQTPWIFHCEDDWEFFDAGFIEKSFDILEHDTNILQVHLRATNDLNGHPVYGEIYKVKNTEYQLLVSNWLDTWGGFSTNPGLRRTCDQLLIDRSIMNEADISRQFVKMGRSGAILTKPYVRHIGWRKSAYRGQYPGVESWGNYIRRK